MKQQNKSMGPRMLGHLMGETRRKPGAEVLISTIRMNSELLMTFTLLDCLKVASLPSITTGWWQDLYWMAFGKTLTKTTASCLDHPDI